ncbi:hypothetical protein [Nostoc sp.]|uniref:hypothetical protein n=1 Tax=Nostoc sp. TaxID=1180 RepID=UPI002FFC530A
MHCVPYKICDRTLDDQLIAPSSTIIHERCLQRAIRRRLTFKRVATRVAMALQEV